MTENKQGDATKVSETEHDELSLLYQNAASNLEFLKKRQWYVFASYSAIAAFLIIQSNDMPIIAKAYISVVLLIGTISAVLMLEHYQQKMSTERKVLNNIHNRFSPLFRDCRSPREDVKKPDIFEKWFVGLGGYAYLIVTFIFVMIFFWYKHIC